MSRPTSPTYRTRNWPAYNDALKRRGSLTIWFDPEMSWDAAPTGRRGRQQTYSDAAIQMCLSMKVLFGMALRQTTGFVESLLLYLNSVVELASKVARKDRGRDVPESIRGDEDAQAFFGILDGRLKTEGDELVAGDDVAAIAQQIIDIIKSHLIVDIWSNEVAQNNLRNAIDDYFFDVLRDEKGVDLPVEVLDELELKIMDLARARFAA